MIRVLTVLAILFVAAAPSQAQLCRSCYHQQAVQQVYVEQKVVAAEVVAAPLYVTVPVVSQAVPIEAYGVRHYYSVQEAYQQRAAFREMLREELRNYIGQTAPQPQAPQAPAAAPQAPTSPPAAPGGPQAPLYSTKLEPDTTTPADVQQALVKTYNTYGCVGCHTPASPGGGLSLVLQDGQLAKQNEAMKWKIYGFTSTGLMPKAARNDPNKAVKQEDLMVILKYTAQGR